MSSGLGRPSWSVGLAALVGGLVVVTGVYARVAGLGARPLAVDEYYFLQGVVSILDGGLPELPGGGLYVRGMLIQYLTAGVIRITGDELAGLRLPSVVFGLLATVATWLLARQWTGRWGAFALSCVVLLSSWEIEFSRFGRMYAGFQLVSLVFLVVYTRAVRDGRSGTLWALPPLCLAAVLCHFTALFFLPLLFVPFVTGDPTRNERPPASYAFVAVVVAAVSVGLERFDFR
ncbi:MAG TPA: glycosyltransferase family 39 protein, partial [Longimicrobiales bacterium]|nr:glycosyltransferase family 39 protein [Longimicrobiales bacterium]